MIVPLPVQLVLNPRAGNGQGLGLAKQLESALRATGLDARTLVVRDPAEARAWLDRHRGDIGYLFCVGGDGTLSEIAPAALRLRVPLIPVPVGFGNIFARTFGYRAQVSFLLDLLVKGEVRWVDVGVKPNGIFLSSQGFGFLQEVKRAVEEHVAVPHSSFLRYVAYVRTALGRIKTVPLPSIRVKVDGETIAEQAPMVIVANVPTYRGFLTLTPAATPFDGLLDVFVMPPMKKHDLVLLLFAFLLHLPHRWDGVLYRQARRVSLEARGKAVKHLTVLPQALPILARREPLTTRMP